jgi:hypothetical protein
VSGAGEREPLQEAFAAAAENAPPAAGCPDPDRLWAGARGELDAAELPPLVRHTAGCPACAEAWRLARALPPEAAVVGLSAARPRRRPHAWIAAAAVIAAAAAVLLYLSVRGRRDGNGGTQYRGGARDIQLLIDDGATLPRDRLLLRWASAGTGARYDVHVFTADLDEVDRALGIADTAYQVAPVRTAALPGGAVLVWRVEAALPDGETLTSPTRRIHLP